MKRLVRRVQDLGDKAKQIQQAIQSVPPKIAEITESVTLTTTQLQQLRANVQASAANLRVEDSDRMIDALDEINGATEVFAQAGYAVSGVDMELSPAQRLIVHLEKIQDVSHSSIRGLLNANQANKTVHALLSSLLQAEAVVDRVTLNQLEYQTLVVHLGPVPIVRLCWRGEEELIEEVSPPATPSAAAPASTVSAPSSSPSAFGQSSFFERPAPQPAPLPASAVAAPQPTHPVESTVPVHAAAVTVGQTQPTSPAATPSTDWKRESLDRFKKMPGVSKYRR